MPLVWVGVGRRPPLLLVRWLRGTLRRRTRDRRAGSWQCRCDEVGFEHTLAELIVEPSPHRVQEHLGGDSGFIQPIRSVAVAGGTALQTLDHPPRSDLHPSRAGVRCYLEQIVEAIVRPRHDTPAYSTVAPRPIAPQGGNAKPMSTGTSDALGQSISPPRYGGHMEARPVMLEATRVEHIPLSRVDLHDETYRFRAALRIGPLKQSLEHQGQQLPVVVRKIGHIRAMRYQLISGFRRATALHELGAPTIAAIVRHDLDDDEAAFRASVLENSQRKTYSDLDRALVIQQYEARGYRSSDVAELMGLSKRQKNNLKSLLDLPRTVQVAIDDPASPFTATHGLVLKQLKGRYPRLHYSTWVQATVEGNDRTGLSVSQLKRAVNARYRATEAARSVGSIFRADDTDPSRRVFRLQPMKIDVDALSEDERADLRAELQALLAVL